MSSILDALRKSEHDRQIASGQSVSMLYPVEVKSESRPWLIPTVLALVAVIITAFILAMWPRPSAEVAPNEVNKKPAPAIISPQADSNEAIQEHSRMSRTEKIKPEKLVSATAQKKIPVPVVEDIPQKLPEHAETMTSNPATIDKAASSDPLKGLPALNITGYIHNEQSGSLVMINNQLVREGEEISPGLHLVKILDDKAIFSYKGYVFSR